MPLPAFRRFAKWRRNTCPKRTWCANTRTPSATSHEANAGLKEPPGENTNDEGAKNINPVYLKIARSFHLNFFQVFKDILLPSALPSIVTGLRLGFNFTLLGVVLGELIASSRGLGFLLAARAAEGFIVEEVIAIVLFLFLFALVINGAFGLWERTLTRGERAARYGR